MAKSSPIQMSLALLRDQGWLCEIVEHKISGTLKTRDLLGFGDILCLRVGEQPLIVQTTTRSNQAARRWKVLQADALSLWLQHGRVVVHGWGRSQKRGEPRVWKVTECEITRDMLAA
jgi:hypothetical protein